MRLNVQSNTMPGARVIELVMAIGCVEIFVNNVRTTPELAADSATPESLDLRLAAR
jgi:hypothetical protein